MTFASASRLPTIRAVGRRRWRFSPAGLFGLAVLALIVAAACVGPEIWPADPERTNLLNRFAAPSRTNPLGTDDFGRDLLARLLHGARLSLIGGVAVLAGSTLMGLVIGGLSASVGGRIDAIAGRTIDSMLAMPSLVVALGAVGIFGQSFEILLLSLVATSWPWYARIYRSLVIKERRELYVEAATVIGCSPARIAWRHIGPNVFGPAVVVATVNLGNAILSLASLSFLGFGVAPPTAEWGAMVNDARPHFQSHPWLIVAPGLAISLTVVAVNLVGDWLRDIVAMR
jgi:peptide/nickel transport system permease protein